MKPIDIQTNDLDFSRQIQETSHTRLTRCWHCQTCSGGCPFSQDMDALPNQVLRMVQLGMKEEVLRTSTIWLCVGCNTCATECPNAIDVAAVMDALRQVAIAEKIPIAEPGILAFHKSVVDSIHRYGRTHKLEIMMRYKLTKKEWFSDIDLGLKMLARRKLDLMPSKVKDREAVRALFNPRGGRP